ncbi:MAG: MoaD/ThiS family protein [Chitinophagales bacterium]
MAKIIIPTPLRKFTGGKSSFESNGTTVQAVVDNLVAENESLGQQILDSSGSIRSFIRVYVGDEDINELEGADTAINENTIISIVPAIAGGIQ